MKIILYGAIVLWLTPFIVVICRLIGHALRKLGLVRGQLFNEHPGFKFDMRLSKEMNYYRLETYIEEHTEMRVVDRDKFDEAFDRLWKTAIAEHTDGTFSDIEPEHFGKEGK